MEKKCKFKVGDTVINNGCAWYTHTGLGFIGEVTKVLPNGGIVVKGKSVSLWTSLHGIISEWVVDPDYFNLYTPHEGKILIMVDEKDNNKIIARDLLTNKTAEAKCNPKDEWNFNTGAKLALERLTEPEKPKGWTGKVVCTSNSVGTNNGFINDSFYPGKVYEVKEGSIIGEERRPYTGIPPICDVNDLINGCEDYCPIFCSFIEYKGGADE